MIPNGYLFDRRSIPFWVYALDEDDMKKYKKEYKYLNTTRNKIETFRVYDFLAHIPSGLKFNKANLKRWIAAPIESVNFKLVEDNTKILVKCTPSDDQTLPYFMYEWANKIIVYDSLGRKWYASLTGWVEIFRRILYGVKNITQS